MKQIMNKQRNQQQPSQWFLDSSSKDKNEKTARQLRINQINTPQKIFKKQHLQTRKCFNDNDII